MKDLIVKLLKKFLKFLVLSLFVILLNFLFVYYIGGTLIFGNCDEFSLFFIILIFFKLFFFNVMVYKFFLYFFIFFGFILGIVYVLIYLLALRLNFKLSPNFIYFLIFYIILWFSFVLFFFFFVLNFFVFFPPESLILEDLFLSYEFYVNYMIGFRFLLFGFFLDYVHGSGEDSFYFLIHDNWVNNIFSKYFEGYIIGMLMDRNFCLYSCYFSYNLLCYDSFINAGNFVVTWGLNFNVLILSMFLVVLLITMLVMIYSLEYMKHDYRIFRFFICLFFFMLFMLLLVCSRNFVQLFIGWEGVGLVSYLLVNFWSDRYNANKSALKALLMNRFGDISLIVCLCLMFFYFKTLNFEIFLAMIPFFANEIFFSFNLIDVFCFFLILGAMGKSAQFGLHTWLPDAMEGPTPVSALLHAATMVTAGVFVLLKFSYCLEYSRFALNFLMLVGVLTIVLAGTIAIFQNDLKKVIAYSTCSQLGYMFYACGLSNYSGAFFHLVAHAFFKALLFLSAGIIIHAFFDEQDSRRQRLYGGFFFPFVYVCMLFGNLSLIGFPIFSGFYSKDYILEYGFVRSDFFGKFCFFFAIVGVFLTIVYSFRVFFIIFSFHSSNNSIVVNLKSLMNKLEKNYFVPLAVLLFFTVFFGYYTKNFFLSKSSLFFREGLHFSFYWNSLLDLKYNFDFFKLGLFFLLVFSMGLVIFFSHFFESFLFFLFLKNYIGFLRIRYFILFFNKRWFFDIIYNKIIVIPIFRSSYSFIVKSMDRGFLELLGSLGFYQLFKKFNVFISLLNISNFILSNIILIFVFIFFYFILYFFGGENLIIFMIFLNCIFFKVLKKPIFNKNNKNYKIIESEKGKKC